MTNIHHRELHFGVNSFGTCPKGELLDPPPGSGQAPTRRQRVDGRKDHCHGGAAAAGFVGLLLAAAMNYADVPVVRRARRAARHRRRSTGGAETSRSNQVRRRERLGVAGLRRGGRRDH